MNPGISFCFIFPVTAGDQLMSSNFKCLGSVNCAGFGTTAVAAPHEWPDRCAPVRRGQREHAPRATSPAVVVLADPGSGHLWRFPPPDRRIVHTPAFTMVVKYVVVVPPPPLLLFFCWRPLPCRLVGVRSVHGCWGTPGLAAACVGSSASSFWPYVRVWLRWCGGVRGWASLFWPRGPVHQPPGWTGLLRRRRGFEKGRRPHWLGVPLSLHCCGHSGWLRAGSFDKPPFQHPACPNGVGVGESCIAGVPVA